MTSLSISIWLRLDAFLAALALWLLLCPRWIPQAPGVQRSLWIKLGVFALVVHVTLALITLGGLWLKVAMVAVAAMGSHELTLALLAPGPEKRPYRWLAVGGAVAIAAVAGPAGAEIQALVLVLLAAAALPVYLERPAGACASAGAVALIALLAGLLPAYVIRLRAEHAGDAAFLFPCLRRIRPTRYLSGAPPLWISSGNVRFWYFPSGEREIMILATGIHGSPSGVNVFPVWTYTPTVLPTWLARVGKIPAGRCGASARSAPFRPGLSRLQ